MKWPALGATMKVLDLGCGSGKPLVLQGVTPADEVVGLDLNFESIQVAKARYPERTFVCGRGEDLRFLEENSFDRVVCNVALPYMKIPRVLSEIHRVLRPGGSLWVSVHTFSFNMSELYSCRLRLRPTAYRGFVAVNGVYFHLTGSVLQFKGTCESVQTRRGMTKALERNGFQDIRCAFLRDRFKRLIVEATKAV